MCHQAGMRPFKINTTVLPGAVRTLQDGEEESALKEAYSLQFSEVPQMAAWGAQKMAPRAYVQRQNPSHQATVY